MTAPHPLKGAVLMRFAEALKTQTTLPVILWEESFTTQDARAARLQMGASRKSRSGHLDDLAATILLQSYLDARSSNHEPSRSCLPWLLCLFMLIAIGLVAVACVSFQRLPGTLLARPGLH